MRTKQFLEPSPMSMVDTSLRNHVAQSRGQVPVEQLAESGEVPVVVVPKEVICAASLNRAVQAAVNLRG